MDQQQYTTLVDVLKQVPDPRKRKGRRHRWLTLLCLIVAAVASAQHTPRAIARWVQEHREDVFAVLPPLDMLLKLPAHPADHKVWDTVGPRTEKGHGRLETRTLTCGNAHIEDVNWPDVQHVVRRECERIVLKTSKRSYEVTYGMVSMAPSEAGAAAIERLWRGHWTIENPVQYVREVAFGEDARHAAQGNTAHVLAALRNGVLMLFRSAHWRSIPAALAHLRASVARAFALIGLEVKT